MAIACRGKLTEHSDAGLLIDLADLRHNKSAAAFSPCLKIGKHRGTCCAVKLCQVRSHWGHHETVLNFYFPDMTLFKKFIVHFCNLLLMLIYEHNNLFIFYNKRR